MIAILGGLFGAAGAFIEELRSGAGLLAPVLAAPIIEEALKPSGTYLMLYRFPRFLLGQLHVALLTGLAGLTFGLLEAVVYVSVYVPQPPAWFVAYRFSLPLAMHAISSFIVGLGLNRGLVDWAEGRGNLPKRTRNLFLTGVGIHALFNLTAISLALAGPLDVD
ncbi:MAG TPA: PrsW family glutamic-type intramembrane protease [Dehalococcoidia bacterium]|nr:PrsW family glutamic-type intramembrane protease [Dehalococcoidia bacterium]